MIEQSVKITYERSPRGMAQEYRKTIVPEAMKNMALHWHTKFLPLHFTQGAYRRYGVEPTGPYALRKRAMRNHKSGYQKAPMVQTGFMRTELLSVAKIKVSPRGANLYLHSRAFNFISRRKKGYYPDFRAEVRAIVASEPRTLAWVVKEKVREGLNDFKERKTA